MGGRKRRSLHMIKMDAKGYLEIDFSHGAVAEAHDVESVTRGGQEASFGIMPDGLPVGLHLLDAGGVGENVVDGDRRTFIFEPASQKAPMPWLDG